MACSTNQIRQLWLDYFQKQDHYILEPASLVPHNDPSLLWINAGIATLKDYFAGVKQPVSNRLANCQKCLRTNDITNVGLTARHHTFFEMLGNFSIGDYFREKAIYYGYDFVVHHLGLDPNRIYITVYAEDEASYSLWQQLGISANRILKCGKDRNFWQIGNGPCGPCTEIYYDRGPAFDPTNQGEKLFWNDIENDRYIELWNIVFSEFNYDGQTYVQLAQQNIDTGAGLERLAAVLQGVPTNFDTDNFVSIRNLIQQASAYPFDAKLYFAKQKSPWQSLVNKAYNVIIDHLKAACFALADGVVPSGKDRGYVVRKILRRAFFFYDFLQLPASWLDQLVAGYVAANATYYPYLATESKIVSQLFHQEYKSYQTTLQTAFKQWQTQAGNKQQLLFDEQNLFTLVHTHGFPMEIIQELQTVGDLQLQQKLLNNWQKQYKILQPIQFAFDFDQFALLFADHQLTSKTNAHAVDGISKQNANLVQLAADSYFDYEQSRLDKVVITHLMDEQFALVDRVENGPCYFVTNQTCLYATSGGQVHDVGYVLVDEQEKYEITNVIKAPNWTNIHYSPKATLQKGQVVSLTHDVLRREKLRMHHSCVHLLHAALKQVISPTIKQEGTLKLPEKMSLDFNYHTKPSMTQIIALEQFVNKMIAQNHPTQITYQTLEEAQKLQALGYFEETYKKIGEKLRVVQLGPYSLEICGGTHVKNTQEIKQFQIINLISKGSGSYRLEGVGGVKSFAAFHQQTHLPLLNQFVSLQTSLQTLAHKHHYQDQELTTWLNKNAHNLHFLELKQGLHILETHHKILAAKSAKQDVLQAAIALKNEWLNTIAQNNTIPFAMFITTAQDPNLLLQALLHLTNESELTYFLVVNQNGAKNQYWLATNSKANKQLQTNLKTVQTALHQHFGGKGGGQQLLYRGSFATFDYHQAHQLLQEYGTKATV